MEGAKSGEFASSIAVDRITRLLPRSFRLSAAGIASGFNDILSELFAGRLLLYAAHWLLLC